MAEIYRSKFENTRVRLDGNQYKECTFVNSTLEYGGAGPVGLVGCVFDRVQWVFVEAAANTVRFLQALYHADEAGGGGKTLIEKTFEEIRKRPR